MISGDNRVMFRDNMISIIVPVYNTEDYLSDCLKSIQNQTYSDIEIILVDDGSTDSSGDICDMFAKEDERIAVIHTKNRGVSVARNTGLEYSHGEWVMFVDADDIISQDACSVMISNALNMKADITICGEVEFSGRFPSILNQGDKQIETIVSDEALIRLIRFSITDHSVAKLFHKDLFENLSFPAGIVYGEDTYTVTRLVEKATNIVLVNYIVYYYRQIQTSVCNSAYKHNKITLLDVNEDLMARYGDRSNEMRVAIASKQFSNCMVLLRSFDDPKAFPEDQKRLIKGMNDTKRDVVLDKHSNSERRMKALLAMVSPEMLIWCLRRIDKVKGIKIM